MARWEGSEEGKKMIGEHGSFALSCNHAMTRQESGRHNTGTLLSLRHPRIVCGIILAKSWERMCIYSITLYIKQLLHLLRDLRIRLCQSSHHTLSCHPSTRHKAIATTKEVHRDTVLISIRAYQTTTTTMSSGFKLYSTVPLISPMDFP